MVPPWLARFVKPPSDRLRVDWLDQARGVALAAMVLFHGFWDLAHVGFVDPELAMGSLAKGVGHAIAASFLLIVGVSLTLAGRLAWTRLASLVAAAALVSAGTYLVDPATFVVFGILHCIAVASLLAWPLLRTPWWLALGCGVAALGAPLLPWPDALSHPALLWLGLGRTVPVTVDWQPLFPGSGFVLLGLALGQFFRFQPQPSSGHHIFARALARAGRHSLAVYLIHQPLVLGAVVAVAMVLPPAKPADEQAFLQACVAQCEGPSHLAVCVPVCGCVVRQAKDHHLWASVLRNSLTPQETTDFNDLARACVQPAL